MSPDITLLNLNMLYLKYYEKVDKNTVKFTLLLEPRTKEQFNYVLRTYHGVRQEDWEGNRD